MAKRFRGGGGGGAAAVVVANIRGLVRNLGFLHGGLNDQGVSSLSLGGRRRSSSSSSRSSAALCSHSNWRFHELCSFIVRNQSTKNWATRAFAQERLTRGSSRLNSGTRDPAVDEEESSEFPVPDDPGSPVSQQQPPEDQNKQKSFNSDSAGQTPTPSLSKQMTTRDFINSQREERLNSAQGLKLNTEQNS